jgi:hypothetical protein
MALHELADDLARARRDEASLLAPKLFADKPKELQKRIRSYWMLSAAHESAAT